MEPLVEFTGLAGLLNRVNIDTDAIIPKQFLKGVGRDGLGKGAFFEWRYLNSDPTKPNPEFELNLPRFQGASVLVAGDNLGCGSSREHAPWALKDMGFRAYVSTSFADIFYNNSIKNGLLPAIVSPADHAKLIAEIEANEGLTIAVNLPEQTLTTSTGLAIPFSIEAHTKLALIKGQDDIGLTLEFEKKISAFEEQSKKSQPWLG